MINYSLKLLKKGGDLMLSNIGKFIVIEGSEGAGKTLQAAALTKYLQEQGINGIHTKIFS